MCKVAFCAHFHENLGQKAIRILIFTKLKPRIITALKNAYNLGVSFG